MVWLFYKFLNGSIRLKKMILALSILFLTFSCMKDSQVAKTQSADRSIASESEKPSVDRVFAAVTGNFNEDPYSDVALLINNPENEHYLELWVYLSNNEGHGERYLAFKNTKFFYKVEGPLVSIGEPSLSVSRFENRPDSIVVSAEHFGVGRSASSYDIKFSYRDGRFVFSGVEWSYFDKLTHESQLCSYNLLTGKYESSMFKGLKVLDSKFHKPNAESADGKLFSELTSEAICPMYKED